MMTCVASGILLLDKAQGLSSARAIAQVKARLRLKKIGHAGTLDPMATGLLVCLINGATRFADYALKGDKVYTGSICLGLRTTTDDLDGEILDERSYSPVREEIEALIRQSFSGVISQVPPSISAVKVQGMAAYDRVRKRGENVQLAARQVEIKEFGVESFEGPMLRFRIRCTPGTYIRSIARDMGELLGCGGCIASLRREFSHPFSVERARKVEELSESDILDWFGLFEGAPVIEIDALQTRLLENGNERVLRDLVLTQRDRLGASRLAILRTEDGTSKALLEHRDDEWKCVSVVR